jgi:hypothetical protein
MSVLLFLTHYIRYYNIKPADGLRVMSIALQLYSTNFMRPESPQSSTHYLPAEATFVTPLGISPAAKYARSGPNSLSTSFERT